MSGFWAGYICGFLTPVLLIGMWAISEGYKEHKRRKGQKGGV